MEPLTRKKACVYCKDTGHEKTNCIRLQKHNAFVERQWEGFKLRAPYLQGQGRGAEVDPMQSPIPASRYEDLVRTLSSAMSSEVKTQVN